VRADLVRAALMQGAVSSWGLGAVGDNDDDDTGMMHWTSDRTASAQF